MPPGSSGSPSRDLTPNLSRYPTQQNGKKADVSNTVKTPATDRIPAPGQAPHVAFVGTGPGDFDLLTVRAV
ncbi:MAG: hypothetical protein QOK15_1964, partial [Nocardioidaceae bacterium]|nr:hypothetical protein [Nocardioidaceae bacterium]